MDATYESRNRARPTRYVVDSREGRRIYFCARDFMGKILNGEQSMSALTVDLDDVLYRVAKSGNHELLQQLIDAYPEAI